MSLKKLKTQDLLNIEYIFTKPVEREFVGICSNYLSHCPNRRTVKKLMIDCCKELDVYSGDSLYPIEDKMLDACDAFYMYRTLWDESTQYGIDRLRVLELMRSKIKQELDSRGMC